MKSVVITIVGNDKPGLIESLAKTVYQHKGNWLSSNFSHMSGHFAGFAEVHIPEAEESALVDALSQHPDLNVVLCEGKETEASSCDLITVDIVGNDKAGIVQELTGVLNQFNLNICSFDSKCGSAPNWGSAIFKARAQVEIPKDFDVDQLKESLESIANDLMVEVKFD